MKRFALNFVNSMRECPFGCASVVKMTFTLGQCRNILGTERNTPMMYAIASMLC